MTTKPEGYPANATEIPRRSTPLAVLTPPGWHLARSGVLIKDQTSEADTGNTNQ
jgi:hypothetical protein